MAEATPYLIFTRDDGASSGKKTEVWRINSKSSGDLLGTIKWFGRWRQYTFWPEPKTTFNWGCLVTINRFLDTLMKERKLQQEKQALNA